MGVVTLRLNDAEEALFRNYATITGRKLSELFKSALAEQIEDQLDLEIYEQAMEEYRKDGSTISHAELKKELGL